MDATTTLKAKAFKTGLDPSDVSSETYTVTGQATDGVIDGGQWDSLVLRSDGTPWVWGRNNRGQHAKGSTGKSVVPISASTFGTLTTLTMGGQHAVALK